MDTAAHRSKPIKRCNYSYLQQRRISCGPDTCPHERIARWQTTKSVRIQDFSRSRIQAVAVDRNPVAVAATSPVDSGRVAVAAASSRAVRSPVVVAAAVDNRSPAAAGNNRKSLMRAADRPGAYRPAFSFLLFVLFTEVQVVHQTMHERPEKKSEKRDEHEPGEECVE